MAVLFRLTGSPAERFNEVVTPNAEANEVEPGRRRDVEFTQSNPVKENGDGEAPIFTQRRADRPGKNPVKPNETQ